MIFFFQLYRYGINIYWPININNIKAYIFNVLKIILEAINIKCNNFCNKIYDKIFIE